jgi:hypothetical protein
VAGTPIGVAARAVGLLGACVALSACNVVRMATDSLAHPKTPFAQSAAPPAPDYAQPKAWMAFPGRGGLERSAPPGVTPVDEATAPADLFFIHPTTYVKNDVWNAGYDGDWPLNKPVLLDQVSIFNGCCRLYAPQYRQASVYGLKHSAPAVELAYDDLVRAFRYYIAHENHGRPFIIAGHSQGGYLAVRLLQEEVLGTPLQKQLVAAYALGAYVPSNFGELGLPPCASARQTGCVMGWNTSQAGRKGALMQVNNAAYWWRGGVRMSGTLPSVCTNPLTWTSDETAAPASANPGSLPFPAAPFPTGATTLSALWPHLTGAVCKDRLLQVDLPKTQPAGYRDALAVVFGSYHVNDMGMFYAAVRQNAIDRAMAFTAATKPAAN